MRGNREVKFTQALKSANQAAGAVNGDSIDALGYGSVEFAVNVGTPGASGTIDVKVQHADAAADGSAGTFADVTSGALAQQTATGLKTIRVDTRAVKRFLRVVCTVAVATSPVGVTACLRHGAGSQPETDADLTIGFT